MTILLQVPSQQYTPRTFTVSPTVASGTKRLSASFTRESWPAGAVGSIAIKFPDGSLAASVTLNGGTQLDFLGNVQTSSGLSIQGQMQNGVVQNLPSGVYSVTVQILQPLTTAVLVESF